jgi:cysteine-rich repeat protein
VCGDGLVHAGVEACDDGNAVDGDECSNACAAAGCGDGVVQMGEDCDLGANNSETGACLPSCKSAACGDGFVLMGVESCDDGNLDDGDGCSSVCHEPRRAATGSSTRRRSLRRRQRRRHGRLPQHLPDRGLRRHGRGGERDGMPEECDDGNTDDNDACPTTCKNAKCGDGFVFTGEECDDGQVSDTCDGDCKRSAYWVFVTSTKFDGGDVMEPGERRRDLHDAGREQADRRRVQGVARRQQHDSAAERLFHSAVRYILPNKAKIADDWSDLTDGGLDLAITRDETG